ncbi:MAG: hypothetical protein R3F60_06265 [bacterium]
MPRPAWPGRHPIPVGTAWRWCLGPLTLYADNRPSEWRLSWRSERDPTLEPGELGPIDPADIPAEGLQAARFTSHLDEVSLELVPGLADRPVVIRPDTAFWLLGGERVDLFASTPVWVGLRAGESGRTLTDLPSFRPSDTWFGPNPREGELAYSSKTRARLDREPRVHPFRAATRITVVNHEADPLRIERVKVPVPNLALYLDEEGTFWTSPISLERIEGGTVGRLQVLDGPPAEAVGATLVAPARQPWREAHGLTRALGALLS